MLPDCPDDIEEKIAYERVLSLFYEKDLDIRDVQEHLDACEGDGDRIGVLLRWIEHASYDDEWKSFFSSSMRKKYL